MSHMSQKDINEKNAEHSECEVEYADKHCKECQMPYWVGVEGGFCSESCKELYELDKEITDYYKIDTLIHEKDDLKVRPAYATGIERFLAEIKEEQEELELVRNGHTGRL